MKALIVDTFPGKQLEAMGKLGVQIDYCPKLKPEDIAGRIGNASILVVRSTRVSSNSIASAGNLSLIIRAGAGVNTIDLKAANARGIYVANCPGKNSVAVAELTMGLLLALDRRIVENVTDLRAGLWNKGEYSKADGVMGKVMGVIGVGRIGQEVIARAQSFGLHVAAYSRSLDLERAKTLGVDYVPSVRDLVPRCDIISVHLALTPETRGLIDRELIGLMKPGAIFLNTSRAEIVDEQALTEAARAGRLRVGTDVLSGEPEGKSGPFSSGLALLPNVYGTHHIGASTRQAQDAVADEVVSIVEEYMNKGSVRNWVNRAKGITVACHLVVRHFDKPGVLANVLGDLKAADINVQEVENVIFEGGETACCTLRLDARPSDKVLSGIRSREGEVIQVSLVASDASDS